MIDMETYGLANGIGWHAFWFVLGTAWLLWWARRPLFIPRYKMLQSGQGKWLITSLDRKIAMGILFGVPLFVLGANAMTDSQYPNAIPLQAGWNPRACSLDDHHRANSASVGPTDQNRRASTADVPFLNPGVSPSHTDKLRRMVAPQGLSLNSQPDSGGRNPRTRPRDGVGRLVGPRKGSTGLIGDGRRAELGGLRPLDMNGNVISPSISTAVIPKFQLTPIAQELVPGAKIMTRKAIAIDYLHRKKSCLLNLRMQTGSCHGISGTSINIC